MNFGEVIVEDQIKSDWKNCNLKYKIDKITNEYIEK